MAKRGGNIVLNSYDDLFETQQSKEDAGKEKDDTLVIDGSIHRYYSDLPRIEIRIKYLNMVYNKHQYTSITNRTDYDEKYNLQYFH